MARVQIPEGILALTALKRLNLGSNAINEISPNIDKWTQLETLILSRNQVRKKKTGPSSLHCSSTEKRLVGNPNSL